MWSSGAVPLGSTPDCTIGCVTQGQTSNVINGVYVGSLMNEDNIESKSLEYLATQLHQCFQKQENYKVACALILLLQQADLLPKPFQRLSIITLLYELYRGEPMTMNPFATVFLHLLHPPDETNKSSSRKLEHVGQLPRLSSAEKNYLAHLITNNKEVSIAWLPVTGDSLTFDTSLVYSHEVMVTGDSLTFNTSLMYLHEVMVTGDSLTFNTSLMYSHEVTVTGDSLTFNTILMYSHEVMVTGD
uniref:CCR4-NOT transcription complex subunit 11 n=1 Tax=Timema tahoe TaxID=61484 RepID=A0A7R9IDQ8_9NEOP|nr:unnamed protein product [Timema tahoe]